MKSDCDGSHDWRAKRHANHKTQVDPALMRRDRSWINVTRKRWYLERIAHNCPIESNAKVTERKQNKRNSSICSWSSTFGCPLPISTSSGNFFLLLQSSQFPLNRW